MLPVFAGFVLGFLFTLQMEATCSSEMSVDIQCNIRRYIAEDRTFQDLFSSVYSLHSKVC
jgi:hypothetical protein